MKSSEPSFRSQNDEGFVTPTAIRYRIIMVSILMAFSLYLTRNAMPEIVKSESFLQDATLRESAGTRFSVELTAMGDPMTVSSILGKPGEQLSAPKTIADGLTKSESTDLLQRLEEVGCSGYLRISNSKLAASWGCFSLRMLSYKSLRMDGRQARSRKALSSYIFIWSLLAGVSGTVTSLSLAY